MYVIICIDVHVHLSAAHHKTTSLSAVPRGSIAQLCLEHVIMWLPSGSLSTQTSWLNDYQAKKWSRLKPSSPEPGYPEKDAPPLKTELARSTAWLKWPRQHSAVPAHSTTSPYGGAG